MTPEQVRILAAVDRFRAAHNAVPVPCLGERGMERQRQEDVAFSDLMAVILPSGDNPRAGQS